jgi:acyl transferase domain-containing protein/acyl carrier protein
MNNVESTNHGEEIAIIGLSGRFPEARDVAQFWRNLRDGVEAITRFSDEELITAGVDPALLRAPNYVKAGGIIEGIELFDAAFFGFNPREAEIMDPQHRIFLECAWHALEHAGYDAETYAGRIGVFAGASMNSYLANLYSHPDLAATVGGIQIVIGNDKDHLPTRVSYKLNLTGPSVNVQTACSTSLVAVHLACQSLLHGECDLALAGGVAISVPQQKGYLYHEEGIASPDGHCRAFDAQARGTVPGSGVGIVALKRLEDALTDGDHIHAMIKGSAINNDGALKVGYTAPSTQGQADVIAEALAMARVAPDTIGYVETHGTGTAVGDPIEISALTNAFRTMTERGGFCAIGSVKTNIGHLDAAAGVAGLIKAVLALQHRQIPPSLNFAQPNPAIDFSTSPFYVNDRLAEWPSGGVARRAGVSSFGIGGTNAHVVLEEAPPAMASGAARRWQLLPLSAKTGAAIETITANLAEHLRLHPGDHLADVAYTLQIGRKALGQRRMLVCRDREDALAVLTTLDPSRIFTAVRSPRERPVVFLFPGQGAQYPQMAQELYQEEPVFRAQVDQCAERLAPQLGRDIREVLYPRDEGRTTNDKGADSSFVLHPSSSSTLLDQTQYAQPALFVIEYALARLWMSWGVQPEAMIGHSIGEYVAACLAGVFSLDDALALVALRGQLMQALPTGAMLSVPLPEDELRPLLGEALDLAAVNAPALCVVSGPADEIETLRHQLAIRNLDCRRLRASHAFHSALLDPIVGTFAEQVGRIKLRPPKIRYLSNVTGDWISAAEATDPGYWGAHLRQTVRFADGLRELWQNPERILIEVGPGQTLSALARRLSPGPLIVASLRHPEDAQSDGTALLNALGRLWLTGIPVDWTAYHAHEQRRRLPLPVYPFERQPYWIQRRQPDAGAGTSLATLHKKPDIADWFYIPCWKRFTPPQPFADADRAEPRMGGLVFIDECGLGEQIAARLERDGSAVVRVQAGARFSRLAERAYTIDPRQRDDYIALIKDLLVREELPELIVHCWSVTPADPSPPDSALFEACQDRGFYSLLYLAQALGRQAVGGALRIVVVSSDMQDVTGAEPLVPAKATLLGPCRVIPQEYPNITCRSIDISAPAPGAAQSRRLADQLLAEIAASSGDPVVAYRANHRWVPTYEAARLDRTVGGASRLRDEGVYLITGELDGVDFELAKYLAQTSARAKLILVGRAAVPDRAEWDRWLAVHGPQDAVSRKIENIRALEHASAAVLALCADVADQEQMQAVIAQIDAQFGTLNGVVHAAEIVEAQTMLPIQEIGPAECEWQFRLKVRGLLALEHVLRGRSLDFCLLRSSLASVLGAIGTVAYAAASLCLDALAHQHNRTDAVPWMSVNFDRWHFGTQQLHPIGVGAAMVELAIQPAEGAEIFRRLFSTELGTQVVISTGDLQARIDQWIQLEPLHEPAKQNGPTLYPRPHLQNAYVAPRDELDQRIAALWSELLGIKQVGLHDNFLELGGNSLLATQLMSRLRDVFHVEVPLRALFAAPTVAGLAQALRQSRAEQQESALLDDILAEIEGLSDDAIQAALAGDRRPAGRGGAT